MSVGKPELWQWFTLVSLGVVAYSLLKGTLSRTEIFVFSSVLLWIVILQVIERSNMRAERFFVFILVRTERGKNFIERLAKYRKFWKLIGNLMVVTGILGMFVMLVLMLHAIYMTYFRATPMLETELLIPGYTIPLWYGIFGLITVALVHELSHGILARAEGVEIKNLGVIFALAYPFGAFVEPDEEEFKRMPSLSQLRIYSAGSFANLLLSFFVGSLILPLALSTFFTQGVQIIGIVKDSPAYGVLEKGEVIKEIKGVAIESMDDFYSAIEELKPQETIEIVTNKGRHIITLAKHPQNPDRGFIGIRTFLAVREEFFSYLGFLPLMVVNALWWIYFLNFIVGLVNLLPIHLGIAATDGHHILKLTLTRFMGSVKAEELSSAVSILIGVIILLNLIKPG